MCRASTGSNVASGRPGLRRHGGNNLPQHAPQPVQLVDEIEDDRNSVVVGPQGLQIENQLHPGEIDFGYGPASAVGARPRPAGVDPGLERLGLEVRIQEKFARFHAHTPIASRGLRAGAGRHWAMNFSSSGSGLSGNITLSVTYSSPRLPFGRGAPCPLSRRTVPVLDHFGMLMVTSPEGVGTFTLPPSTASLSEIGSSR